MMFRETELAVGTAFIMSRADGAPFLVTNRHNVTGRDSNDQPISPTGGLPDHLSVAFVGEKPGTWRSEDIDLYDEDNRPIWREHALMGSEYDVVAIPLQAIEGVRFYPYEWNGGQQVMVAPGDTVSVVGFPFGKPAGGLFPIWATGFMASEPDIDPDDQPKMYIDCRSRPGQSGSPVVAYRSGSYSEAGGGFAIMAGNSSAIRLIGIYCGRINKESDLGIVWKLQVVRDVVGFGCRPITPLKP